MTWTATQGAVERKGFMLYVSFTLTNGAEVINDTTFADDLTADRLAEIAQQRIQSLEARDAAFDALKAMEGRLITLPRDKPVDPDAQAADAFFDALAGLNLLRSQLDKGLIKADDAALASATATVKTGLAQHPEYTKDFRYR